MFRVTTKTKVIRDVISMASSLVKEVKVDATPDGISLRAVDPSHVSMLSLDVGKEAFTTYEADTSDFGLDLAKLKDAIKTAGEDLSMELDESVGKLTIKSGNITRKMNVLDTSMMQQPKIPSLNFDGNIKVLTDDISKGITASSGISDAIALASDGETFSLTSGKENEDNVEMVLTKPTITEITVSGSVRSMVPLEYFTNVVKSISAEYISFGLSNDYPVRIEFDENGVKGMFLIAPRIESE